METRSGQANQGKTAHDTTACAMVAKRTCHVESDGAAVVQRLNACQRAAEDVNASTEGEKNARSKRKDVSNDARRKSNKIVRECARAEPVTNAHAELPAIQTQPETRINTPDPEWLMFNYLQQRNCLLVDNNHNVKSRSIAKFLAELIPLVGRFHLVLIRGARSNRWVAEFEGGAPSLRVHLMQGSDRSEKTKLREKISATPALVDVVIVPYDILSGVIDFIRVLFWGSIVLDEGHQIKNENTNVAMACSRLQGQFKLILSTAATPNRFHESWAEPIVVKPLCVEVDEPEEAATDNI